MKQTPKPGFEPVAAIIPRVFGALLEEWEQNGTVPESDAARLRELQGENMATKTAKVNERQA